METFTAKELNEIVRQTAVKLCPSNGIKHVPAANVASVEDETYLYDAACMLELMAQVLRAGAAEHRDGVEGRKRRVCWICDQCGAANDITLDMCHRCHATRPAPVESASD